MRKSLILLALALWGAPLFAQSIPFLPQGHVAVGASSESTSWNERYTKQRRTSRVIADIAEEVGLSPDDFTGQVTYSKEEQRLNLQWGLADTWNLGLTAVQVTRKRDSSLAAADGANQSAVNQASAYASIESSGSGDSELWAIWRPVYTDENYLHFRFLLVGEQGNPHAGEPDQFALGSGSLDYGAGLQWIHYSLRTNWRTIVSGFALQRGTKAHEVNDEEIVLHDGFAGEARVDFENHLDWLLYGLGLSWEGAMARKANGVEVEEGHVGYLAHLYLGAGNLSQLEQGPLALPWELRLVTRKALAGLNQPLVNQTDLSLWLYF